VLNVPVVVDNKPGGNGSIAGQLVARANAEATTLLVQYSGFHCITPLLQPVHGFDPAKDLKPIANLVDAPQVLVVRNDFPANNVAEFLKYVKSNPGRVNYASSGNGSLQHVTTELLKDITKTFMLHIPYRGTGAALVDLLSGTVDMTITTPPPLLAHIRSGRLKALVSTGRKRIPALPNVPIALESGLSLVASSWFALFGPSSASPETVNRISSAVRQVVESDGFRKKSEDQGAQAAYLDSARLAQLAETERSMWARVIAVAKIKAD
jgi:tripartite-type tricarboxylate transporter receptor subunit TctC